ncbi:MAG: ABC transporter substrate-binding protein [Oscillatoriales cyanobacterium SM2_2_1]|nr:ABC transporter substrate-binding protein [Oscillatoriales cyanobacterium SM2_2_1]
MGRWLVLMCLTVGLVVGCQSAAVRPTSPSLPMVCPAVTPVSVRHAKGFTISYHLGYKKLTVTTPWVGARESFVYILRLCDRPIPEAVLAAKPQILAVPVRSWISLSSTHLTALALLAAGDRLIGVDAVANVHAPALRQRQLVEVGGGARGLNVEAVLAAKPDVVSAFGVGSPQMDAHPKLLEAGIPVAIVSDYLEETPLGRAEWIKFFAAFLNQEGQAEELFRGIESRYLALKQRVGDRLKEGKRRPTVLVNFAIRGQWFVPSGRSYVAAFLTDAGADYFWTQRRERLGSIPLDWETVLRTAGKADFWLHGENHWQRLTDAITQDERYQALRAVQLGQVYNNNRRLFANGSNDYWERGVMEPDVILGDLIKIFHPELLPKHNLVYYRRLGS